MVWYTISFVIFLWIIVRFGKKPILAGLDSQIAKVRQELEEARRQRAEAEKALASYKVKREAAAEEAALIITEAKKEADRLRVTAKADLEKHLSQQEQRAMERIKRAETDAVADVRSATIDMALATARKKLTENMDSASASKLLDQAISEIEALSKS
jgi:F-type H+-transporting ATPase subunit b